MLVGCWCVANATMLGVAGGWRYGHSGFTGTAAGRLFIWCTAKDKGHIVPWKLKDSVISNNGRKKSKILNTHNLPLSCLHSFLSSLHPFDLIFSSILLYWIRQSRQYKVKKSEERKMEFFLPLHFPFTLEWPLEGTRHDLPQSPRRLPTYRRAPIGSPAQPKGQTHRCRSPLKTLPFTGVSAEANAQLLAVKPRSSVSLSIHARQRSMPNSNSVGHLLTSLCFQLSSVTLSCNLTWL